PFGCFHSAAWQICGHACVPASAANIVSTADVARPSIERRPHVTAQGLSPRPHCRSLHQEMRMRNLVLLTMLLSACGDGTTGPPEPVSGLTAIEIASGLDSPVHLTTP